MIFMEVNDDYSEKTHYSYANYPLHVQEDILSNYPDYKALAHWHDDIEIMYILSGELQYSINGEIITIRQGDGVFVNTRQMHFGFSPNKADCAFICVRIHPMLLCTNAQYEKDFVIPVLTNSHIPYIHLIHEIDWHNQLLQFIPLMNNAKNTKAAQLKILSYFLQIWALLYERIPYTAVSVVNNSDFSALKNMLSYIQRNYAEKISLSEIASAGGIGQSKCCKLFAKYVGQTPNNYLTSYRLQRCAELLQNTDMSITEIALAAGFGGGSYLTETFRKKYGTTPTKYRVMKKSEKYKLTAQNEHSL